MTINKNSSGNYMNISKLKLVFLFILISPSFGNASDTFNEWNGFGSIEASLVSFVDFNVGMFFVNHGLIRGKGFDISLNPGLSSSNIQIGYGDYNEGGSCGLPSIFSIDLLIGRSYLFNGIISKNEFYSGIQLKIGFTIAAFRLGVLISEKNEIRPNLGIGVGL